jgi:hypothetical protein
MADEIKVTVADYGKQKLTPRRSDPRTGKPKAAGTEDRNAAQNAAGKWEDNLNRLWSGNVNEACQRGSVLGMSWSGDRPKIAGIILPRAGVCYRVPKARRWD